MDQKPSVGRIVHYTPPNPTASGKVQPYPAVITHVWSDSCVNLSVHNDGSFPLDDLKPTSVTQAGDPSQPTPRSWSWPPRV